MTNVHPNRAPFRGVLACVDKPSNLAAEGSRGHCVLLPRAEVEAALPSLLGMAINYRAEFGKRCHDNRNKVGIITDAELVSDRIEVAGYIFAVDFPDVIQWIRQCAPNIGMSYELHHAHVADMRAKVWELKHLCFLGAAIALRENCAYANTSFTLDDDVIPSIAALSAEKKD